MDSALAGFSMYDTKKLDAYWKYREEVWANWRKNGWDGNFQNFGRYIRYECGCEWFAGWGVSLDRIVTQECIRCICDKERKTKTKRNSGEVK